MMAVETFLSSWSGGTDLNVFTGEVISLVIVLYYFKLTNRRNR